MPDFNTVVIFALAALILNATPGPSMLYALSHSMARGKQAGFASAFGLATGNILHVLLNAFGFSYLFANYPIICTVLKYVGAVYLLYLGVVYIVNSRKDLNASLDTRRGEETGSLVPLYRKGIIVEFLNPKTALFYISVLPQFINPSKGSITAQIIVLGACVPTTALMVDITVSYFAGTFKDKVLSGRFKNRHHEVFSGMILISMSLLVVLY